LEPIREGVECLESVVLPYAAPESGRGASCGSRIIARRRILSTEPAGPTSQEEMVAPATPIDDNPHSIPVYGTDNPRQKAYPEA